MKSYYEDLMDQAKEREMAIITDMESALDERSRLEKLLSCADSRANDLSDNCLKLQSQVEDEQRLNRELLD